MPPALRPRTLIGIVAGLIAMSWAAPSLGGPKNDVLVMRNGDRLTCEIKRLDSGVLSISLDYVLGTLSVEWSEVQQVVSKQLFIVKTEGGSVYTGTIRTMEVPGSRPVSIEIVAAPGQAVHVESSEIVLLDQTSKSFWRRLKGDMELGFIYSKGNDSTQYSLGSSVTYPRARWNARADFDSTLSSSAGAPTSARNQVRFAAQRLLRWNHWYTEGLGTFLQSSEQEIDLQTTLGGGIGRYLADTNHAKVAVLGGLGWQNTRYHPSANTPAQDLATALIGGDLSIYTFNKSSVDVTAMLFPGLSDPGRVRLNLNAAYYLKVFGDLTWNLSFYGNWDNRPPERVTGTDYGTSVGFGWKFNK